MSIEYLHKRINSNISGLGRILNERSYLSVLNR